MVARATPHSAARSSTVGDLLGDRPVAGLDAAAEQACKLDVARDDASIQIDCRSFALLGLHCVFDFVLRDPRLFPRIPRYVIKLTYRSMPAIGEKAAVTMSAMGSLLLAAGLRALRRGRRCSRRAPQRTDSLQRCSDRRGDRWQRTCGRAAAFARARLRRLRRGCGGTCGGRLPRPAAEAARHRPQHRADDQDHAARLRPRHRRGGEETRRRQSRRRRPCLRQLGGADDRGRPSRPGAGRGDCRGRRQAICAGAFDRGDQGRQPFAFG